MPVLFHEFSEFKDIIMETLSKTNWIFAVFYGVATGISIENYDLKIFKLSASLELNLFAARFYLLYIRTLET